MIRWCKKKNKQELNVTMKTYNQTKQVTTYADTDSLDSAVESFGVGTLKVLETYWRKLDLI